MSNANEIVAMALEEFAGCADHECLFELGVRARLRAEALRSTPSPRAAGGLELFTKTRSNDHDWHTVDYEPIPGAVAVIEAARKQQFFAPGTLSTAVLEALDALDKRLNPKVENG